MRGRQDRKYSSIPVHDYNFTLQIIKSAKIIIQLLFNCEYIKPSRLEFLINWLPMAAYAYTYQQKVIHTYV